MIELYSHQLDAIEKLHSGSILCGGVGTGKSRTALAYYYFKVCQGNAPLNGSGDFSKMKNPMDLYVITTARKRDALDWQSEGVPFLISSDRSLSPNGVRMIVDSWNNIKKYQDVRNAFFIFDEQRLIGSGAWVKAFYRIAKANQWLLLTATPGDTWSDYIPVFVANGFYKNKTQFSRRHIVYSRFSKYPKVERYVGTQVLKRRRDQLVVNMPYEKRTVPHHEDIFVEYDPDLYSTAARRRWDPYKEEPIRDAGALCYILRKVVNSDPSRLEAVAELFKTHPRMIIFYNFDYELEALRTLGKKLRVVIAEWNGHKHEMVPEGNAWLYLVQYTAGSEAWNCVTTDTIVFFSQNYSYKVMAQAAGRIDRLNTPYFDLYYYHLLSFSKIDKQIYQAVKNKQVFNEELFVKRLAEKT
ncbi:MAG: BPAPS putative protein [Chaetfec virus UA24_144]|nr:MAG: BPAPS putative protein [Chaetfec virus UA24_144]